MSKFVGILGLFAIIGAVESYGKVEPGYISPFEELIKKFSEVTESEVKTSYDTCLKNRKGWYGCNHVDICIGEAAHNTVLGSEKLNKINSREQKVETIHAFLEYLNRATSICLSNAPLGKEVQQWVVAMKDKLDDIYIEGESYPSLYFRDGLKKNGK